MDTNEPLTNTTWNVQTIDGAVVSADSPAWIWFGADERVSGTTGLNRFAGSYTTVGNVVTFGPLATTRMAGPPELMERERRLLEVLELPCELALEGDTLELRAGERVISLTRTEEVDDAPG